MVLLSWIGFGLVMMFAVWEVVEARTDYLCRKDSQELLEKLQSEFGVTPRR
jgi:hypothetical protein